VAQVVVVGEDEVIGYFEKEKRRVERKKFVRIFKYDEAKH
jgi:hypothetical protein